MIIQIILLLILGPTLIYFLKNRSVRLQAGKKILFLLFAVTAVVAILAPDALTSVANYVGVGRGADLLLYLLATAFIFVSLNIYLKFKEKDQKIVSLARAIAVYQADKDYPWKP